MTPEEWKAIENALKKKIASPSGFIEWFFLLYFMIGYMAVYLIRVSMETEP